MRLFIAIPIASEIKNYLSNLPVDGRKVTEYHLTLKFLGDVHESKINSIIDALEFSFEKSVSALSNVGYFPNAKRPRVVWIGLKAAAKIIELQKEIESNLSELGFEPDKKFHPHITLARIRGKYKTANISIDPMEITIDRFELIQSTLTPTGPVYNIKQTFINNS